MTTTSSGSKSAIWKIVLSSELPSTPSGPKSVRIQPVLSACLLPPNLISVVL